MKRKKQHYIYCDTDSIKIGKYNIFEGKRSTGKSYAQKIIRDELEKRAKKC